MLSEDELAFLLAEDEKMQQKMDMERLIDPILRMHCVKQQKKSDQQNVESETQINQLRIPIGVKALSMVLSDCKCMKYVNKLVANSDLVMDERILNAAFENDFETIRSLVPEPSSKSICFSDDVLSMKVMSRSEYLQRAVEKNLSVADDRKAVREMLMEAGFKVDFIVGLMSAFGNLEVSKIVIQKKIKKLMDSKNKKQLEAFIRFVIDDSLKLAAAKEQFYFTAEKEYKKAVESKSDSMFDYDKSFEHFMAQHEKIKVVESMFILTQHKTQQDTAYYIDLLQL